MPDSTKTTEPADSVPHSQSLKNVYNRFGRDQTVLVPIKDDKVVDVRGSDPALRSSCKPSYLEALEDNDVAVLCGPESFHLAAIQFNDDSRRRDFLKQNPGLKQTLLTSFPGSFMVWIRVDKTGDRAERGHQHAVCNFLTEGYIMVAARGRNSPYRFDNKWHPVKIKAYDIAWPRDVATHRDVLAIPDTHPKFIVGKNGAVELNDDYIVALLKAQTPFLYFDPDTNAFYTDPQGEGSGRYMVYSEFIKKHLHEELTSIRQGINRDYLRDHPPWLTSAIKEAYPESKEKPPPLVHVDTTPRHLDILLELFKIQTARSGRVVDNNLVETDAVPEETINQHLEKFINVRLELAAGESVTVTEAYAGYVEYCEAQDVSPLTLSQFRKRVGEGIMSAFGVEKNHSTLRNGKSQRGFRNLRIKYKDPADEKIGSSRTGTQGTDRTPAFERAEQCGTDLESYLAVAG